MPDDSPVSATRIFGSSSFYRNKSGPTDPASRERWRRETFERIDREGATPPSRSTARPCEACGKLGPHRIRVVKAGYPIWQCDSCGLASAEVKHDSLAGIYEGGYFSGAHSDGYADYAGSEGVLRREFRDAVAALRRSGAREGRLLEVGCAYGFFLLEAAQFFEASGIDVSAPAIEACRSRGLQATCGELTREWLKPQQPFDAVVMLDVIEHLPRPFEVLEMLHDSLRPGGTLMITTGDLDSVYARLSGRHWRLLTPPQHVYFFSERSLTILLARAGYEVIQCVRPWKVVPVGLMLYQLTRRMGWAVTDSGRLSRVGVPVNLFDVIRVIARRV